MQNFSVTGKTGSHISLSTTLVREVSGHAKPTSHHTMLAKAVWVVDHSISYSQLRIHNTVKIVKSRGELDLFLNRVLITAIRRGFLTQPTALTLTLLQLHVSTSDWFKIVDLYLTFHEFLVLFLVSYLNKRDNCTNISIL